MIWNRACGGDPLRSLPGDRALPDLLRLHNHAMNSGLLDAVESLTASEVSFAEAGYRFYGFREVALLVEHARRVADAGNDLGSHEARLDRQYADLIPLDSSIHERFEDRLKQHPLEFAPLRPQDRISD